MAELVGLMPIGGSGLRLGLPFPKPLAPVITSDKTVEPLYRHTYRHLLDLTPDAIYGIITPHTDNCLRGEMVERDVKMLQLTSRIQLPAALGWAAQQIVELHGPDTMVAVVLPDSIWDLTPGASLRDVLAQVRGDGAVALFNAKGDELDEVFLDGDRVDRIVTKHPLHDNWILGWGAFIVRAAAMTGFTDEEKDGPQLGRLDMGWAILGAYVDLGTPERYIKWHDLRGWYGAR